MPRKKKDPNEMTDDEMMTRVFSKRIVKGLRSEVGADDNNETTDSLPSKDQDT